MNTDEQVPFLVVDEKRSKNYQPGEEEGRKMARKRWPGFRLSSISTKGKARSNLINCFPIVWPVETVATIPRPLAGRGGQ